MDIIFEGFIKKSLPLIRKRCGKFSQGDIFVQEDLYSTVLEKIWRYRGNFKGNEVDFQKWISRVVKNAYIDYYRKKPDVDFCDIEFTHVSDSFNVINKIDNIQKISDITRIIKLNFKDIDFSVFDLHLLNGWTIEDTAAKLYIPVGSVKNKVHRMRKFIIKQYGNS